MKERVYRDFRISQGDIFQTIMDVIKALEDSQDDKIKRLHDRLDMQFALLRTAIVGHLDIGGGYAITYKIPSHLKSIDENDVQYYVCPDYEDLERCAGLEQKGECKILTINGVEWDKDDYEYYFDD